jgi:hypothetical protein
LGQTTYAQLDYYLGQTVNVEGTNGIVSSVYYNDALDRPKQVIRADNGGADARSQTTISYDDMTHVVTTKTEIAQDIKVSANDSKSPGRRLARLAHSNRGELRDDQ